MDTKALIIGWDGGCFNVLDQMLKKQIMPNLNTLIKTGVRANFLSTVPPITAPAWTSFRTGRSPENHGIFSFFKPPASSLDIKNIERHDATSIKNHTFWNILNLNGKKVCIIDMPLTDPVEEIDGIMISGMMTRGKRGVLAYPDSIIEELNQIFPDYFRTALSDGIDLSPAFLDQLVVSLEWKRQLDLHLMRKYPWHCFVTVFSVVDVLQHYFWKFIDPESAAYQQQPKISEKIDSFFNTLDDILGQYLQQIGENDSVYIISDHGFGPANYGVSVNNILQQAGYLKVKGAKSNLKTYLFNPRTIKKILKKLDLLHLRVKIKKEFREQLKNTLLKKDLAVDWPQTKAYFRTNNEECIYINHADKFRCGSVLPEDYGKDVDLIVEKLERVTNPDNEERVFEFVKKRDHFYNGIFKNDAPDIILRPAKGYTLTAYNFNGQIVEPYDNPFLSGVHSRAGIFVAKGPAFKRNFQFHSIKIEDFVPILLHTMQIPIPGNLDGKVRLEILEDNFIDSHPIVCKDYSQRNTKNFQSQDEKLNEEEIKERLAQLGYID